MSVRASIVVLTYDQLKDGTVPCVESIFKFTSASDYELVLVDNASSDGTPEYLRSLEKGHANVKVILNDRNKGYAGGNNDGIRASQGQSIVLMNNDTLVTPGWLDSLLSPLEKDRSVGLISPVTNSAGNEQMIIIPSLNEENYVEVAGTYTGRNKGHIFETNKLGFYCVALRRDVLEKVGLLDENFGMGMFEDDDYCLRARNAGYRLVINDGCFIYHKGSLSFKKITGKEYQEIFDRNREYYLRKHGQPWLFNDLTLAYYKQMEREVNAILAKEPGSVEAERVAVRLKGFEFLIQNAREMERKGGSDGNAMRNGGSTKRILRMFRDEYLKGDRHSRTLFKRKVHRRLRPLKAQEIIDRMGEIRRKEAFSSLIVIMDVPDLQGNCDEAKMAKALASSGQAVLYLTANRDNDAVEVAEKVTEHLYLMNQELVGYLPHLVTKEECVPYIKRLGTLDRLGANGCSRCIVDLGDQDAGPYRAVLKERDMEALFLEGPEPDARVGTISDWLKKR